MCICELCDLWVDLCVCDLCDLCVSLTFKFVLFFWVMRFLFLSNGFIFQSRILWKSLIAQRLSVISHLLLLSNEFWQGTLHPCCGRLCVTKPFNLLPLPKTTTTLHMIAPMLPLLAACALRCCFGSLDLLLFVFLTVLLSCVLPCVPPSGGNGAAVSACVGPFAIGSDVGGSIRIPAFFNGIFGHKPTGGAVPNSRTYPPCEGNVQRYCQLGPMVRENWVQLCWVVLQPTCCSQVSALYQLCLSIFIYFFVFFLSFL